MSSTHLGVKLDILSPKSGLFLDLNNAWTCLWLRMADKRIMIKGLFHNRIVLTCTLVLFLSNLTPASGQEDEFGEDGDSDYQYQPPPPPTDIPEDFVDDSINGSGDDEDSPPVPPPFPGAGVPPMNNGRPIPQMGQSRPAPSYPSGGGQFGNTTLSNKLRFKIVEGLFWEKGKKRPRGERQ